MFLEDDMMVGTEMRFNSEMEVRSDAIVDLKQVYYRGRYWTATAWSKVGKTRSAGDGPRIEAERGAKAVDGASLKARSSV